MRHLVTEEEAKAVLNAINSELKKERGMVLQEIRRDEQLIMILDDLEKEGFVLSSKPYMSIDKYSSNESGWIVKFDRLHDYKLYNTLHKLYDINEDEKVGVSLEFKISVLYISVNISIYETQQSLLDLKGVVVHTRNNLNFLLKGLSII